MTKYHKLGSLQKYISKGWNPKIKALADSVSVDGLLSDSSMASSHFNLTCWKGQKIFSWAAFVR
jgi:hypothetical protein